MLFNILPQHVSQPRSITLCGSTMTQFHILLLLHISAILNFSLAPTSLE